jgi:hypothetical protein
MLGDFEDQAVAAIVGLERGQDRRQLAVEGDVDDGADDLGDATSEVARCRGCGVAGAGDGFGLLGPAAGLGGGGGGLVLLFPFVFPGEGRGPVQNKIRRGAPPGPRPSPGNR